MRVRLLCLVWNLTDDSYHFVNTSDIAITVLVSLLNMNCMISYDELARFGREFSPDSVKKWKTRHTSLTAYFRCASNLEWIQDENIATEHSRVGV